MKLIDLCEEFNWKESYVQKHWSRIVESYHKMGIELYREGRGKNADYGFKKSGEERVTWVSKR